MSDFEAKMQQIRLRLGFCPIPRWGSYSVPQPPPSPPVGFKGIYFQVQGGEWKGKERTGREGREGRDGRGGEQISEILNAPLFATGGRAVFAGGCVGLRPRTPLLMCDPFVVANIIDIRTLFCRLIR